MMLINLTNHPSDRWSDVQIKESEKYGEILDLEFPEISSESSTDEISEIADKYLCIIKNYEPLPVVLCQGEMCFVFNLVTKLLDNDIKVICATSRRIVQDIFEDNQYKKISVFEFSGYREYRR